MASPHTVRLLYSLLAMLFASASLDLLAAPPSVDSIDYATPDSYLSMPASLGDRGQIVEQAEKLRGRTELDSLRRVLEWMETELRCEPERAYEWRNFDDVLRDGCYGSCADQAIVCGVLLRALGIPTVWVKTMDVAWIWDFKKGRPFESWSGHVFLEVYLNGNWVLLDPGAKLVYQDYSPRARILPGNRFAYHKGNDPQQMIMSLQWEEWKAQTREYFAALDSDLLPVDVAAALSVVPQVYIVGNDPAYKVLTQMAQSKGWTVTISFNSDYETLLPAAKGKMLLIETHRGKPIVAGETLEQYFPGATKGLQSPDGIIECEQTTIMFVDFARMLNVLDEVGDE